MSTIDQIYLPNPLQPATGASKPAKTQPTRPIGATPFSRVLDQTGELKFSQHAQERLKARNITFSQDQLQQLEGAVNSVAQKGARNHW